MSESLPFLIPFGPYYPIQLNNSVLYCACQVDTCGSATELKTLSTREPVLSTDPKVVPPFENEYLQ